MGIYRSEQAFFQSWKEGVKLAGAQWFGDGRNLSSARTIWELEPRVAEIADALCRLSRTERVFLSAMVSFYNDLTGGRLLQRAVGSKSVGMADIAASLDEPRRRIITNLFMSYCGW